MGRLTRLFALSLLLIPADQIDKRLTKFTETFRHFTENVWIFAVDNSDELLQCMTPDVRFPCSTSFVTLKLGY
jgi:hypothetical protein